MRILMLCPFSTPSCSPVMSRPVIQPLSAGATAPEALSLLHQRLLVAEEQAESLIREMGSLGVSREQLLEPVERDPIQRPISPVKMHHALREPGGEGLLWRQCDGLVSRVCRMESLLQTLKLTTFRLETERDLDPSHSGNGFDNLNQNNVTNTLGKSVILYFANDVSTPFCSFLAQSVFLLFPIHICPSVCLCSPSEGAAVCAAAGE